MRIISSVFNNWQFRQIDHNGSNKAVSVLSAGTPENGAWQGVAPCPFKRKVMGAEVHEISR